jgi:carbonic anhydrase/acetyltransferase-like protein (isoleucine patch superfamily)
MRLRHDGAGPTVDPTAYVAPSAVLSGAVTVGPQSRVLHGAVLTAEGGSVGIGSRCVVMEQAVIRGTRSNPTRVGDHVLVGPHAYLTGCDIEDEVFIATGAMIFNGARMEQASSVALGGAVHIRCRVPAQTRIPIGWVAVGDPARLHPPGEAESIRAGLTEAGGFFPYVFGVEDPGDRGATMRQALSRYTKALGRHRGDEVIGD